MCRVFLPHGFEARPHSFTKFRGNLRRRQHRKPRQENGHQNTCSFKHWVQSKVHSVYQAGLQGRGTTIAKGASSCIYRSVDGGCASSGTVVGDPLFFPSLLLLELARCSVPRRTHPTPLRVPGPAEASNNLPLPTQRSRLRAAWHSPAHASLLCQRVASGSRCACADCLTDHAADPILVLLLPGSKP